MASLRKRGHQWWVQYYWEGQQYRRPLGTTDEQEAKRLALQVELALHERRMGVPDPTFAAEVPARPAVQVADIVCQHMDWAKDAYDRGWYNGMMRRVSNLLVDQWGPTLVADFGPVKLRQFQERLVAQKLALQTCNHYVAQVKRIFKWASSRELCPVAVYQALATVENLKRGRSKACQPEPRRPVLLEHVEAVRAILPPTLQDLVELQPADRRSRRGPAPPLSFGVKRRYPRRLA